MRHDEEWITLIKEARELGLSVEEVRSFLKGDIRVKEGAKEEHLQD
ncbi:anti-repressor SinI family protein [Lentibacillus salicampi]|uniref:DNA-binding anti-repressor SinI n=1 Tax=Lentibacillus salicampi TaxID=175306 RepID=A0A4Y9AB14_9BACI|nr:anti-repressor SinI family protein [Lentibacillus salicampi]TFJ92512.1 DNA-binding anti-repressor SinI [Lentibacillus salicampi]